MDLASSDDIADLIYEAAVVPELWPDVLARLSRIVDGDGGLLFTAGRHGMRWTASDNLREIFEDFVRSGWAAINPRPVRLGSLNYAGFVRDNEHFTPEELETDPVYKHYRKIGLGWAAGTMLNVPSGDAIVFSFERAYRKGPIPLEVLHYFDGLRPHLARAALLGARFGLKAAQTAASALGELGLPAAVLRGEGALFATNALMDALIPSLVVDGSKRMSVTDQAADLLLQQGLDALSRSAGEGGVRSIPVAAIENRKPLILHLLPLQKTALDIFTRACALLIVTPVDRGAVPTAEVLSGLFDLTPAEARVAREIAGGATVETIAHSLGVSQETIRTHLKRTLSKTGLRRQTHLAALLAGVNLPRHPPGS